MMVKLLSIAFVIFIAAGLGGIGLVISIRVLDRLIDPSVMKDPQYGMSFIAAVPIGGILGGVTGYVLMLPEKTKRKAGIIFSVVGGASMMLCLGMGLLSAVSLSLGPQEIYQLITSTWSLVPLIASLAMMARGIYLLTSTAPEGVVA